jgi:hypothetical protein
MDSQFKLGHYPQDRSFAPEKSEENALTHARNQQYRKGTASALP